VGRNNGTLPVPAIRTYHNIQSSIDATRQLTPTPACTVFQDWFHIDSATEHLGKQRQYWRDVTLGVNDGLVSTFILALVSAGVAGSTTDILLTAISGSLAAGSVKIFAGDYMATKSQDEVLES